MKHITFLGLGAMGSRMALNLIKEGYNVTVWNRTASAAQALVSAGATFKETPAQAAQSADVVISMVRDNQASEYLWNDAQNGAINTLKPTAVAIECSTISPQWAEKLGDIFAEKKLTFLEAPVSGSRPQAQAASLIFLVGGEQAVFEKVRPVLNAMGKTAENVIGKIGMGAYAKLCVNTIMGIQTVAVAEMIAALRHHHINPKSIVDALATTATWSATANRDALAMLDENFAPQFPIDLIEKDFNYFSNSFATSIPYMKVFLASHEAYKKAKNNGLNQEQMSAVIKNFSHL